MRPNPPSEYDRGTAKNVTLKVRPIVAQFALLMEARLQANDKSKPHWKASGLSVTWAHLKQEVRELEEELMNGVRPAAIAHEASDVACLAAMIVDIMGAFA